MGNFPIKRKRRRDTWLGAIDAKEKLSKQFVVVVVRYGTSKRLNLVLTLAQYALLRDRIGEHAVSLRQRREATNDLV